MWETRSGFHISPLNEFRRQSEPRPVGDGPDSDAALVIIEREVTAQATIQGGDRSVVHEVDILYFTVRHSRQ